MQDNAAEFVVRCRDRIKVLVQDAHPTGDPSKSESFYLLTAMAPGGEAGSLAPKLRENATFTNLNLRDFDAVALTGTAGLAAGDIAALTEFVKAGERLMIFPGPQTDAKRLQCRTQGSVACHPGGAQDADGGGGRDPSPRHHSPHASGAGGLP